MTSERLRAIAVVGLALGLAAGVDAQQVNPPRRGAFQIATIHSAGDRDIIPRAIPSLTRSLRDNFQFDLAVQPRELSLRDPILVRHPLLYLHGQSATDFPEAERAALRRHLDAGGGTLFVDAGCGSPAFDASFRRFAAELMPGHPLVPIPKDDALLLVGKEGQGFDLANSRRTKAAGGKAEPPDLEGVRVDGRWAIIYSPLDIGSALEKTAEIDCKAYTHESALRIATNIVLYATLP